MSMKFICLAPDRNTGHQCLWFQERNTNNYYFLNLSTMTKHIILCGPATSGKTTLAKAICALVPSLDGFDMTFTTNAKHILQPSTNFNILNRYKVVCFEEVTTVDEIFTALDKRFQNDGDYFLLFTTQLQLDKDFQPECVVVSIG